MAELPNVRFLTVAEVAELMRVSKMTVYRLVHSGELPAVRFGRSYRGPRIGGDRGPATAHRRRRLDCREAYFVSARSRAQSGLRPDHEHSEVFRGFSHQEAPQAHGEEEAPQAASQDPPPAPQQEVAAAQTPSACPLGRALRVSASERFAMKSIDVHQLHAREGVPLIDVREAHEFAGGHVPGSVNLPMSTIGSRLDELPEGPVRRDLPGGRPLRPRRRGARGSVATTPRTSRAARATGSPPGTRSSSESHGQAHPSLHRMRR